MCVCVGGGGGGGEGGLNRSRKRESYSGVPSHAPPTVLKFTSSEMARNASKTSKQLYIDKNTHHRRIKTKSYFTLLHG